MGYLEIFQLVMKFGPLAYDMIASLSEIWGKEGLTPEEVQAWCKRAQKPYADYIAEERAKRGLLPPIPTVAIPNSDAASAAHSMAEGLADSAAAATIMAKVLADGSAKP